MTSQNFTFNYKNKTYNLKIKECKTTLSKTLGLMFKKNSPPLLFIFKKPTRQPIHSFFCNPFLAIWFNNNQIIDVKLIKKWKLSIRPKQKFNKLLEIPTSNKQFQNILEEENI